MTLSSFSPTVAQKTNSTHFQRANTKGLLHMSSFSLPPSHHWLPYQVAHLGWRFLIKRALSWNQNITDHTSWTSQKIIFHRLSFNLKKSENIVFFCRRWQFYNAILGLISLLLRYLSLIYNKLSHFSGLKLFCFKTIRTHNQLSIFYNRNCMMYEKLNWRLFTSEVWLFTRKFF